MTEVRLLEEAQDEFLEAVLYYTAQSRGVGTDFVQEVRHALDFIKDYPEGAPGIRPTVHRKTVRKRLMNRSASVYVPARAWLTGTMNNGS